MADATYSPKVYKKDGGDSLVVASGGDIDVEDGGDIDVASGGDINVASGGGVEVASGGEINIASGGKINIASGAQITAAGTQAEAIADPAETAAACATAIASIIDALEGAGIVAASS